jgi:quercetin dioxygenase-like cupin family protein
MAEHAKRGIHLAPGEGAAVKNPVGGDITFKLRAEQTNGALSAFESVAAPGEGPPLHVHVDQDEVWYVLEGRFRIKLDTAIENAPPGTFVFVPRGVAHAWQNVGDAPARFLAITTPAGLERFFERFAEIDDDADKGAAFRTLGKERGMEVVGPQLAESHPL